MNADLRSQTVGLAWELGFDLCRFAEAKAPSHAREFQEWLAGGHAGEMDYLARNAERRVNPQEVLPDAKSIIVLALNYFQGKSPTTAVIPSEVEGSRDEVLKVSQRDPSTSLRSGRDDGGGRIARYAWGDDYHQIIEEKLKRLDSFLCQFGGRQKFYVDTGPVLERDQAAAAGIGWHGKSTMLLNRQLGTWFFLAEVLTTLKFTPDEPVQDHCGKCTRCIDACPTGAITAPHRVDARRCISYLTIESKGAIPLELRPLVGDRIYGCDDCLDACPWNRFAKMSQETKFSMRPEMAAMQLRDYLALDEEKFRALFRRSPIKRTKRRGLLRNVCVALGNVGTVQDLPALEKAARDPEPLIAEHASWAIDQIKNRVAIS